MRRLHLLLLALPLSLAACGDDDGGTNNQNTNDPLAISTSNLQAEGHAPDYSCLGQPDPALSFAVESVVTGIVQDFEEKTPVAGAVVAVYESVADVLANNPFDESAPSAVDGSYVISVPANQPRLFWKNTESTSFFDTVELGDPAGMPPGPPAETSRDRLIVSNATVDTVQLTLGIARIAGRGVVSGTLYDCKRDHIRYGALRVYDGPASVTTRTLLSTFASSNRNSFYFVDGMPSRLQAFTDPEGQFLVANLLAGSSVTVEFWGRLDAAWLPTGWEDCSAGCQVATAEVPVMPDTIVIADVLPLYSAN
jgi:hypothetical protein